MGVRGLFSFLRQYSIPLSFEEFLNEIEPASKIGIDISFYLYKWQGNLEKITNFLTTIRNAGHRPILVFDGRASEDKQYEAARRRNVREEEIRSANAILSVLDTNPNISESERKLLEKTAAEHMRRGWSLTKEIRHGIKKVLQEMEIPMIKAKGEADGLLASMNRNQIVNQVISGDMDLLVMGAPQLCAPVGDGLQFRIFTRAAILNQLKLSDQQFREMCAMCFTETQQTVQQFDIRQAYHGVRVQNNLDLIQKKHPDWIVEWPKKDHMFLRADEITTDGWVREDQLAIQNAQCKNEPMPQDNSSVVLD